MNSVWLLQVRSFTTACGVRVYSAYVYKCRQKCETSEGCGEGGERETNLLAVILRNCVPKSENSDSSWSLNSKAQVITLFNYIYEQHDLTHY